MLNLSHKSQHGLMCRVEEKWWLCRPGSPLLFGDWCFTGHFPLPPSASVPFPQFRRCTTTDLFIATKVSFLLIGLHKMSQQHKNIFQLLFGCQTILSNPENGLILTNRLCLQNVTRILSFPDYRRDFSSDSPASAVPDKPPVTPSTTAVNSSRESSSSSTAKLIEGNHRVILGWYDLVGQNFPCPNMTLNHWIS